jgi:serine/threonine protein kinase
MPALESLPRKIGPYRPIEKIGEGGMGVVYLARDTDNRTVAVKVLGPAVAADPDARQRLAREVETMSRIRSRYVAQILDADVSGPAPYVVTRYVPGRTLDAAVREAGPLRGPALNRLAFGLAEALEAIHAAGVVHRDLKPANVMLEDGQPVVIDFGIAHVPDATRLTRTGLVMGTPGYVAPEVIEGQPSTGATDVHSWGTTVAFAASGRLPFGTGDFQSIFYRVLQGDATLTGVPPALLPLVRSALATDPRSRPTARWLAAQCAESARADETRMDRTGADGTRVDRTRLDRTRGDGAGAGGARPSASPNGWQSPSASPNGWQSPSASPNGWQSPSASPNGWQSPSASPNGWPSPPGRAAYPTPAQAAADMADLLPAVDYARPRPAAAPSSAVGQADRADRTDWPSRADRTDWPSRANRGAAVPPEPPVAGHGVVALAAVIGAIALTVLLPVAGTVLVLAVITLLRAADMAQSALTRRRSLRGAEPSDILVVIVSAPWTVARALLKTALLVPFALVVAVPAAIAAVVLARAATLPVALSWAAGAAVAWYCVGTGSQAPRRQLRRMSAAMIPTRTAMVVAGISTMALALAVVTMAISEPPLIWPATSSTIPHLLPSLNVLPSLGSVLHSLQRWLLGHTVGMLHLP